MFFAITISSGAIQAAIRQLCVQPLTVERFCFFCSFRSCFSLVSHDLRWCIAGCDRVSELYKAALLQFFLLGKRTNVLRRVRFIPRVNARES